MGASVAPTLKFGGFMPAAKRQKFEQSILNTLKENLQGMLDALGKIEQTGGGLEDFIKKAQSLAGNCERLVQEGQTGEPATSVP